MGRIKTVVVVEEPVKDEHGRFLNEEGDVIPDGDTDTVKMTKDVEYYLLHWGKETNILYDNMQNPVPYENTMAICQNVKTGWIKTFFPAQLKVISKEIKTNG